MLEKTGHLFKLKEWLTIPDAAKYLSIFFREEVGEADVLRLALDGHLKLSVYFVNHAYAKCGKVVPFEGVEWYPSDFLSGNPFISDKFKEKKIRCMKSLQIDEDRYLNLEKEAKKIIGVWDLSMVGSEVLDVEFQYQNLIDGPEVTLITLDGPFVQKEDSVMWQIQASYDDNEYTGGSKAQLEDLKEHISKNNIEESKAKEMLAKHSEAREKYLAKRNNTNDYYPAGGLPTDSLFVVRTQALVDLQNRIHLNEKGKEETLEPRAEKTYLNIIGALLDVFMGTFKDEKFSSEAQLRNFIDEKFDDLKGVRARTLAEKFALAKKALNDEL